MTSKQKLSPVRQRYLLQQVRFCKLDEQMHIDNLNNCNVQSSIFSALLEYRSLAPSPQIAKCQISTRSCDQQIQEITTTSLKISKQQYSTREQYQKHVKQGCVPQLRTHCPNFVILYENNKSPFKSLNNFKTVSQFTIL